MTLDQVESKKMYPASVFCDLVINRGEKRMARSTFHRWRLAGRIVGADRSSGTWKVPGSEILRHARAEQSEGKPLPRTDRQRTKDNQAALDGLRRMGLRL